MKKKTLAIIAGVSVAGAIAVGVGAASDWYKDWSWLGIGNGNSTVQAGSFVEDENFILTPNESDGVVALSVKPRNSGNSKVAYPSYTITASVNGSVSDPKIDWSVEKLSDFSSSATDPVTVTPTSDGALTATITCKAAFSGGLNVVATLRGVGSFATCSVVFEGIPSELNVSVPSLTKNGDYYEAAQTGTYSATVNLDNVFHSVGSKYGQYTVTATAHGTVGFTAYNNVMGQTMPMPVSKELSELDANRLMTFSISGNTVTIKVNGALSSYTFMSGTAPAIYTSEGSKCYYEVKVVDTVSGLYTTFNVAWSEALKATVMVSKETVTF